VGEAIMLLLTRKAGVKWSEFCKEARRPEFLRKLLEFEKDNVSNKLNARLDQYLAEPVMDPAVMGTRSLAAAGLCRWVRGINIYVHIAREVAPMRAKLRMLEREVMQLRRHLERAKRVMADPDANQLTNLLTNLLTNQR